MTLAKGYRMARSKRYKSAKEAVLHAGMYSYIGRKLRRRDKRSEWIVQINAGLEKLSTETANPKIAYSKLISGLKTHQITLDRKIIAHLTMDDFFAFRQVVEKAVA